jgi:hypothetical protein
MPSMRGGCHFVQLVQQATPILTALVVEEDLTATPATGAASGGGGDDSSVPIIVGILASLLVAVVVVALLLLRRRRTGQKDSLVSVLQGLWERMGERKKRSAVRL